MRTPSASSTSAVPHCEDAARFPCLHTGTPAPATTNAAIVEMFTECDLSPPVPTMSIVRFAISAGRSTRADALRTSASIPSNSTALSPLVRRPMTRAAICAEVASPSSTVRIAARASFSDRSVPEETLPSSAAQPPTSSIALIALLRYAVWRRWRNILRRSRAVAPPHTPCCSRASNAYSRHAMRTTHCSHTDKANSA